MAASLSRPDPSSPASVAEAGFSTARRGFHQDEVRAFLTSVAGELGRLQEHERQLQAELREARQAAALSPATLDEATATELLGEETVRVLRTARESASQIKIRAEENAARIVREANDEVNRLRQETEVDTARQRQEAAADAEAEVALAKQQGREMVNESRAYRERVLADLDRRTTLARKQIEELIQGRDRLLQVFERARLVAVDVTSELHDIDTPDELVNLTPTTGPVPIMVPNERRPTTPEQPVDDVEGSAEDAVEERATTTPDTDRDTAADDIESDTSDGSDAHDLAASDDGTGESPVTEAPARDANVVSLFRDRGATAGDQEADDAGDTGEGSDAVGGIFARLRDELPDDDAAAANGGADDTETVEDVSGEVVGDEAVGDEAIGGEAVGDEAIGDEDTVETAFSRRDEALVPLIVGAARKIKRVLADEQNVVLDRLRQREPVAGLDDLVPGVDAHTATYRDAIADELTGAAAAGAVELGASDTRTLRNRLGKAGALDDATAHIRTALIGPLRDRLARSVADGDGDNEAITKRIRAVYREWKTQHIDSQLDDVFRYAHGGGVAVTAEPGWPMVWTIDPSEPACPDCEDNSLSGSVPAGEPFPTGHSTAPAHPGCRCLVLPAS